MADDERNTEAQDIEPAEDKPAAKIRDPEPSATESAAEGDDALRIEVERLREENAKLAAQRTPGLFWRNAGAAVLIVIGALLFTMAISAVWLNRTVMDENRWVETVAPLAQDTAIQNWVATKATDALFKAVDIQSYVQQALSVLPPKAQILATPITGAVQNYIRGVASSFVHSARFPALWIRMNRLAHKAFIASITPRTGQVINSQNGQITLDVSLLVDQIKQALSARGLTFVSNITIPVSQEQIVLYNSPALANLGTAIQVMNSLAYILPILAVLLFAGGVALAVDRRKAVLWLGVGIVIVTVLPLEAIYFAQTPFTKAAYSLGGMPTAAAQHAYQILFRYLVTAERLAALLGLVFVAGALVAGPSSWAVALRGGLQHGLNNIGPEWDFGAPGEWILAHASGLRTTGVIVAIAALLVWPTKSVATIVWIVIALLVWLLLVSLFGRPRPQAKLTASETADATKPDAG